MFLICVGGSLMLWGWCVNVSLMIVWWCVGDWSWFLMCCFMFTWCSVYLKLIDCVDGVSMCFNDRLIDCRCCIHISFSLREPACKHFGQKSSEIKGIEATQKMLYMYFCTCTCNSLLWTICFNSGSQKRRLLPSKAATSLVPKREATSCSLCRKSCATTLEKDAKVERRHPGLHILSCHNIFCTSVGSPKLCGMQLQRPWIL